MIDIMFESAHLEEERDFYLRKTYFRIGTLRHETKAHAGLPTLKTDPICTGLNYSECTTAYPGMSQHQVHLRGLIGDEIASVKYLAIKGRIIDIDHWPIYLGVQYVDAAFEGLVCIHTQFAFARCRLNNSFNMLREALPPCNMCE